MAGGQRLELSTCNSVKSLSRMSSSKVSGKVAQDRMTSRICSKSGGQSPARLQLKLFFRFGSKEVVVDLDECCCSVKEGREMVARGEKIYRRQRFPEATKPNQN